MTYSVVQVWTSDDGTEAINIVPDLTLEQAHAQVTLDELAARQWCTNVVRVDLDTLTYIDADILITCRVLVYVRYTVA